MFDTLTDGFGVLMNHGQETTVENYYATEEYKDFVTTMYDWQQKGYLSKDAATSKEGVENQVKAGSAFWDFSATKPDMILEQNYYVDMIWKLYRYQSHGLEQHRFLT